jgi:DNA-binding protein HU-beta
MSLSRDENAMLTNIQNLVGRDKMEGFVAALRNPAIGDRLSAVLQFLATEGFTDEVVIAVVQALADPAFDVANATLDEIKGIAYVLKGAVEAERTPDAASLKDMRVRAAEQFVALEARRANRMQKPQLLAHLATKCGLSENAIASVLNELAELAIRETNAHDAFTIPDIGRVAKFVREERMGRNPQTGEPIPLPRKTIVKFQLDARLRHLCGDSDSSADAMPSS